MEELIDPGKRDIKKKFPRGKEIQVEVVAIDDQGRIRLSQKTMGERQDRESFTKFLGTEETPGQLGTLGDILKDLKLEEKVKK